MTCIVGCLVPVFRPYSEWYHVHQSYLHLLFQHNTMPHTLYSYKPPSVNIFSLSSVLIFDSSLIPTQPGDGCLNVPGPGVSTMGQFTLESLAPSVDHPGSFTVTLATVHSLAGQGQPGTPASGHRDTGLAWQVSLSLHWLLLTSHCPGLHWLLSPGPRNTPHTRWWGRRILQNNNAMLEIEGSGSSSGNKIWRWVTKHLQGLTN